MLNNNAERTAYDEHTFRTACMTGNIRTITRLLDTEININAVDSVSAVQQ